MASYEHVRGFPSCRCCTRGLYKEGRCCSPIVDGVDCRSSAGYVQVPCIERCAYGAVKAWTAYCIASEEIPEERRVDLDTTIAATDLTAREMNAKYKETSEGGLAVSLVLC